ncbi:MAG: hypothetical protein EOO04_37625 [Chitinophagaceae bacterium]|nr:MAG: hypothetical protein EOO04_37625 [Chitinophagaceae bacterium]
MKNRSVLFLLIFYSLMVIFFTIFWAKNAYHYTYMKGDDYITAIQFMFFLAYAVLITWYFIEKANSFILILIIPILTIVLAALASIFIVYVFPFLDTSTRVISIYNLLYGLFIIFIIWKLRKKGGNQQYGSDGGPSNQVHQ